MEDAAVSPLVYSSDYYLQKPEIKGTWHSPYGYWFFMYATIIININKKPAVSRHTADSRFFVIP